MLRPWVRVSLVLVVVLLVASGCGRQATPSASPSTIASVVGRVLISGGRAGGFSPTPHPYSMSEVKALNSSGRVVAAVKADDDGVFRLDLPPGTCTLKASPTSGNPWFAPRTVTLHAGQVVHVNMVAQLR